MNKIIFPLKPGMLGAAVVDLQDALELCLDRGVILGNDEAARRELSTVLQREHVEQTYGSATRKLVGIFQKERRLEGRGTVNEPTATTLNRLLDESNGPGGEQPEFVVKGTIHLFDDSPAAGVTVSAFDRDLRNEQALGQSQTDRRGEYQIRYSARYFLNAEKGSADLVVKAFAADGSLLAASPVLFNAPLVAEVNVTIPAEVIQPPTLFEKIGRALAPLIGKLKVEELEEDKAHQDLSFLSGETGIEKPILARFVLAHTLARQAIRAEFWFVLLGGSFYQFAENQSLTEQLPGILDGLPSLDATAVRKSLIRGFNQKEISETFREKVAGWVEAFLKFVASQAVSKSAKPTFVKSALEDAGIKDAGKQEKFARLFNEHKALTPEVVKALEKDKSFKKTEIADLRTSFRLAELSQGDSSVVRMLKKEFAIDEPKKIRALAKLSEREWVKLVKKKHASGDIKLPIEVSNVAGPAKLPVAEIYGKTLERQFRQAFPTAAFAGGLGRALQKKETDGMPQAEALSRFLESHEEFELLTTPVDAFLDKNVGRGAKALTKDKDFRQQLKAVQRVFKLAPTFEATNTLLTDDLHSAQKVYRLGKSEFVRSYGNLPGFTAESAALAWNRAADTHSAVLTIVGDLKALDGEGLPIALQNSNGDLSKFPNWDNLFKAGDLCECEHCRSVLSPAAYFADLLMFLKDRNSVKAPANPGDPIPTVKDILFTRRPDLGYLELNCENALTPLPYVDVVCEVLEDAVDDENDLELIAFTAVPANAAIAHGAVATALQNALTDPVNDGKEKVELGSDFSLSQVKPLDPNRWIAHGETVTYLLTKKVGPNFFAKVLRNTKGSAEELRAYPQWVNPKAYKKLREAKYPLALPFDLFAEETRAAFQNSNLERWDLMRTLRGAAAPNNPTDGEIAAEYFGISVAASSAFDEKRLILVADATVPGQKEVWGETGINWLDKVGKVKSFLKKTGLEYNELLALLDLKFINPAGDISVHHLDPSCDLDQKVIQVIGEAKLDRIHRFLRLWRKLKGWKMWELDLVIRHPRIGNGALDEQFLINLFDFSRLRKRLGQKATIEQVCALFGGLNTETRFTKLHEKRDDALYQNLFLNRRLINPLDPAFQLDTATGDLPPGETIGAHHPVVLAALGIRESDLMLLKGLVTFPGGLPYITDDLTVSNLSFLWRHSWLAKVLKFKAEEWKILLKLFRQETGHFDGPRAAWDFVEKVDHLKATDFTPEALNWLLAADRSSNAATKEADTARFLTALRKELQAIQAENDPARHDFLSTTPPTDVDSLAALLTSLLQKLNRNEGAQFFIATLRNEVSQEKIVAGLPAGFNFPAAITDAIRYEPALSFSGRMTPAQRSTLLTDPALAAVTGIVAYQQAIEKLFNTPGRVIVRGLPAGFGFPSNITGAPNDIAIRYEPVLRFTGLMTDAERASLAGVIGNTAYQEAINEFFNTPRLALKFFEAVFTAPLASLPEAVDFNALPNDALARKISYDAEERLLRFAGILSSAEKAALEALSNDVDYRNAVSRLAIEPTLITPPDDRIWLLTADLQFPLRDVDNPANDHLAKNLATAVTRALKYLSRTLSEKSVVQQSAAKLGLTEALSRGLFTDYALLPDTLLAHLTGAFAATTGVVDYATLKPTFDAWYWASRVASLLKKWKVTSPELETIRALIASAQLLDLLALPLDDTGAIPQIDSLLRTSRLLRLRDSLPETEITLLEVLEKLSAGTYATAGDFAADVQRLNDAWFAADVEALTASLDLAYPADYMLVESWERMRRAFYFLDNLNASAATATGFAAGTMSHTHAKAIKELLRSKFGAETWLTLSAEIQDVLRERKRDALAAYLLNQPQPAGAPSDKWENTNDLYAHYLLDVEMSSCQLTSRLVQGSGSVQLFVQRSFMGLEPDVEVKTDGDDGDSAWRWWKWMRKYRVWEANLKVFLWPENWIEPELKKDRSQFFKDLENELLQNEVNQDTVESALSNYLEKLDGVAQLEIAGFYQEDDGDNAIIHVFGRTKGAEPHLYYYRRYDYRQWTAWEKVDLDIQGDYLIPAVVNKRLFLFWPVFSEVPDEAGNSTIRIPKAPGNTETSFSPNKTQKKLKVQMAVSDYRQGKWMPKRVSKDSFQGSPYSAEVVHKFHRYVPVDRTITDGRFDVVFIGSSLGSGGNQWNGMSGAFELAGCHGVPQASGLSGTYKPAVQPEWFSVGQYQQAYRSESEFMKWNELGIRDEFGFKTLRHDPPQDDFTLENMFAPVNGARFTAVLQQTPWFFRMSPPWQLSYLDRLLLDGFMALGTTGASEGGKTVEFPVPMGSWLPFFYNDKKRTFFVLPALGQARGDRQPDIALKYYPDIKQAIRQMESYYAAQVRTWLDGLDLTAFTPAQRQALDQRLYQAFPGEAPPPLPGGSPPPYSPAEAERVKGFLQRFLMRYFHANLGGLALQLFQGRRRRYHFKNFYHPFVCDFSKLVQNPLLGVPALMRRETQLQDSGFSFRQQYQPTPVVVDPSTEKFYPREFVDFTPDGAYAPYNWELFFHAPLMIANSLSKNQRFEEARDWYHFIFNPIGLESLVPGGSVMSKYWITKPFFETTDQQYVQQRIENILRMLAGDTSLPGYSAQAKKDLEDQVFDWRTNPFEPHRIANYRTVAYQKTVVMKYLDNLIAWGDYLFRQDSMESINQATQLYILAAEILGPRPKKIPPQAKPPLESFNELETQFDKFSNALVEVENLIPALPGNGPNGADPAPLPMLYFCIPQNDKMLGYWDTVADRLYKIRHCMNIEGVVRQLALFEPPFDPGALVKAVAAGVDISSALADLNAPLPLYRFNVLLQKANEVCNDVKALGSALLTALEKKDAEALGLLRQGQEVKLLEAVKAVREKQIRETEENLAGLQKGKEAAQIRKQYYESREFMIGGETAAILLSGGALVSQLAGTITDLLAGGTSLIPDIQVGASGFGGSPHVTVKTGGTNVSNSGARVASSLYQVATMLDKSASMVSTLAGYQRRMDDWQLQAGLANKEIEQIDKSIAAAELRTAIAEKELDNHVLQIQNAKATDEFMRSKYTNEELYQWQVGQISGVYFQSYRLAYDLAKRAERCFRFELGLQDSSYINFGYWDSLKKGLLSGEKLQYDLRRLETAYLEQNRREFELTKHISLVLLDPLALVKLRETGRCFFRLPEEIFDLDYPGHYFRRIKSVSLTLPSVVGPYTTISCTLRLLKNSIRIDTTNGDNGYPHNVDDQDLPADDLRFIENNIPVKSIAASNAQNDSGVFELSFRDERYLPFEGAGVVSDWSLELFSDLSSNNPDPANPDFGRPLRQFDYHTISDAILHIKYTAREDAGPFKNGAITHLRDYFSQDGATPSLRTLNLRHDFPTQWHRFMNPANPAVGNVFEFEMSPALFPFRDVERTLKINKILLLARCTDPGSYAVVLAPPLPPPPAAPTPDPNKMPLTRANQYGGLHFQEKDTSALGIEVLPTGPPVKWQLRMTRPGGGNLQEDPVKKVPEVEDVILVLGYEWDF